MSVNYRETTVNGIRTQLWGQDQETDHAARRTAARLPRDAPDVRRVSAATDRQAKIWIDPVDGDGDACQLHQIPDDLRVVSISHFGDGTIVLTVEAI